MPENQSNTLQDASPYPLSVGLFRRLFAIFYDCFLLGALLFIDSAIMTALNGGHAISPGTILHILLVLSLVLVSFLYFGWFWTHGGQTLGMQTWRMKLVSNDRHTIRWQQAAVRFFAALLSWLVAGAGFFWALFNPERKCWHDYLSRSMIIDIRENKQLSHTSQQQ